MLARAIAALLILDYAITVTVHLTPAITVTVHLTPDFERERDRGQFLTLHLVLIDG